MAANESMSCFDKSSSDSAYYYGDMNCFHLYIGNISMEKFCAMSF